MARAVMTLGVIDSMCTWEVVSTLLRRRVEDRYPWASRTAAAVSYALMTTRHLRVAPAPTIPRAASGFQTVLNDALASVVNHEPADPQLHKIALDRTKRWVSANPETLRRTYAELTQDEENFRPWCETAFGQALAEHSERLGGLFNPEFIPQLARVLDVGKADLIDAWRLSTNIDKVRWYSTHREDSDQFRLILDAFVVAALIRGRYHAQVARAAGNQIMQHPMRKAVSLRVRPATRVPITVPKVGHYLASIAINGAGAEKRVEDRLGAWASSLISVRTAVLRGELDLEVEDEADDTAQKRAVQIARNLNLTTHSKTIDTALDVAIELGGFAVGAPIGFVFGEWYGIGYSALEAASRIAARKKPVGERVGRILFERPKRLRDLATAGPGPIEQTRLAEARIPS